MLTKYSLTVHKISIFCAIPYTRIQNKQRMLFVGQAAIHGILYYATLIFFTLNTFNIHACGQRYIRFQEMCNQLYLDQTNAFNKTEIFFSSKYDFAKGPPQIMHTSL